MISTLDDNFETTRSRVPMVIVDNEGVPRVTEANLDTAVNSVKNERAWTTILSGLTKQFEEHDGKSIRP